MANPNAVGSAIGTQQQFAAQPKATYQKRLITPSAGTGVSISADNGAMMLAQSLGVIGEGIMAESVAMDKRQKMIGEAEASRIFASASDDDKKKIQTLDLLGRSSDFELADNPYAVARIDELRGQYLNTAFKNEYENSVLPNEQLAENSQANIKKYEEFMEQRKNETNLTIHNNLAFNKGFYGNRPMDVLQQDASYRKKKQEQLETERNTMLASKADNICANSYGKPADELAKELQELQNDEALTNMPLDQRIKILSSMGKVLADNGDPSQIEAWGKTVAYTSRETGKPVLIKDIVPFESYKQMAFNQNVHLNEVETHNFLQKVDKMPSNAIYDEWLNLKANKPQMAKALASKIPSIIKRRKAEEEAEAQRMLKQQLAVQTMQRNKSMLSSQFSAFVAGNNQDIYGHDINSKVGADGKSFSEGELYAFYNEKIAQWNAEVQAGRMTVEDLASNKLNLFNWKLMTPYKETRKQLNERLLSSLNLDALRTDADGNMQLPEDLQGMLTMYKLDKSKFSLVFGTKQATELSLLSDFTEIYGVEKGVTAFAEYNQNKKNPQYAEQVKYNVDESFRNNTVELTIPSLTGEDVTIPPKGEMFQRYYNIVSSLMLAGRDESEAMTEAQSKLAETYRAYNNVLIPKAFFYSINSENQTAASQAFLDTLDTKNNRLIYNQGRLLLIGDKGLVNSWDNLEFAKAVRNWATSTKFEEAKAPTVDDIYGDGMTPKEREAYSYQNPDAETIEKYEKITGYNRNMIAD